MGQTGMKCPICGQWMNTNPKGGFTHSPSQEHPEASGKHVTGNEVMRWQIRTNDVRSNVGSQAAHSEPKYT